MSGRSKRVFGLALIAIGLLAAAAGIALGAYNLRENRRAGESVQQVLAWLETATPESEGDLAPEAGEEIIPDYVLNPLKDMPTVEIDGNSYIGTLSIPVLELELPVMETWSYPQLRIAPCRYIGSAYTGSMIICAHNYATHFGRLQNLLTGDEVTFTDVDGNVFTYSVAEVEMLAPTAVAEMERGDWELSLFTCTLGGQTRVTVRCRLLKDYNT